MTETLNRSAGTTAVFFSNDVSMYAKADGPKFSRETREGREVLVVKDMPIFRSGEFRDSMGYEHLFDAFHMLQAVSNFDYLSQGILPDVPVRAGHPSPFTNYMNELIGHIDALTTREMTNPSDGEKYTYLLADFHVQDLEAAEKIESGLWRNRSSEIGLYASNRGQEFYPALVGFAYVGIPAVEGLNGAYSKYSQVPGIGEKFYLIADNNQEVSPVGTDDSTSTTTPPPAPPAFSGQPQVAFNFKLGEKVVTATAAADFAAVQAHIDFQAGEIVAKDAKITELEQFQRETEDANRKAVVKSWVDSGKEFASDQAGLEMLALGLSADQWTAYAALKENAPSKALFGQHAVTPEASGPPEAGSTEDPEVTKALGIYKRHQMSGMNPTALAETGSAKILAAAGKLPA